MYTAEAIKMAKRIAGDRELLTLLSNQLLAMQEPITYSGQDFDRVQALGMLLTRASGEPVAVDPAFARRLEEVL